MFDDEFPPKPAATGINYRALMAQKPDNSAYLDGIARVRDAFRQAETALGGPVIMTGEWDDQNPFVYHMKFTRKP